jgi:hypothetical protein
MIRRRLGVLLVTLAVLAAACQRQSSLQPPRPAAVVSCKQVLAPDAVYHHYRVAVRALAKGQEPGGIPGLRCFLGEDAVQRLHPRQAYRQLVANTFDADILYAALRKRFDKTLAQDRRLGLKRDAGLAWPGAYLSEAALVAFRKTRQQRFLDLFVHYFDAVLQRRDDRLGRFDGEHKRVMPAWAALTASTSV